MLDIGVDKHHILFVKLCITLLLDLLEFVLWCSEVVWGKVRRLAVKFLYVHFVEILCYLSLFICFGFWAVLRHRLLLRIPIHRQVRQVHAIVCRIHVLYLALRLFEFDFIVLNLDFRLSAHRLPVLSMDAFNIVCGVVFFAQFTLLAIEDCFLLWVPASLL